MSKTTLIKTSTERGFGLISFLDRYGQSCFLQDSSLGSEPAIWFGAGKERMHLTQKMVRQILPYLTEFAQTGNYVCGMEFEDNVSSEEEDE